MHHCLYYVMCKQQKYFIYFQLTIGIYWFLKTMTLFTVLGVHKQGTVMHMESSISSVNYTVTTG